MSGTECGVYRVVGEYVSVLTTTELATCTALNLSLSAIKEITAGLAQSGSLDLGEQMVQYTYECVEGDQVRDPTNLRSVNHKPPERWRLETGVSLLLLNIHDF